MESQTLIYNHIYIIMMTWLKWWTTPKCEEAVWFCLLSSYLLFKHRSVCFDFLITYSLFQPQHIAFFIYSNWVWHQMNEWWAGFNGRHQTYGNILLTPGRWFYPSRSLAKIGRPRALKSVIHTLWFFLKRLELGPLLLIWINFISGTDK